VTRAHPLRALLAALLVAALPLTGAAMPLVAVRTLAGASAGPGAGRATRAEHGGHHSSPSHHAHHAQCCDLCTAACGACAPGCASSHPRVRAGAATLALGAPSPELRAPRAHAQLLPFPIGPPRLRG